MSENTAKTELLPCPFCGSRAEILCVSGTVVRCTNEECVSRPEPFNDYGHRSTAIDAWNRRVPHTPSIEQASS